MDLLSVFSEQAPRDIKVFYAFKIYGEKTVLLSPSSAVGLRMSDWFNDRTNHLNVLIIN